MRTARTHYRVVGPLDRCCHQPFGAKWLLRPTAEELAFINGVIDSDDSDSN